ncbi:hypothetical protein HZS_6541 [Henneguya salminicola]|nr:hypothetical protein HZS_6541 [Henneguya salminicola]
MAFVPCDELESAFKALSQEALLDLRPILDWFEDIYLEKHGVMRYFHHRSGMFIRKSSMEAREQINYVKTAHKRMHVEFGMDHPTICKFIEVIC